MKGNAFGATRRQHDEIEHESAKTSPKLVNQFQLPPPFTSAESFSVLTEELGVLDSKMCERYRSR